MSQLNKGAWLLIFSLFTGPSVQQGKRITIDHFKHEPVEIVSIKQSGTLLQIGDSIKTVPDWPTTIEITIKNVSPEPVSYIEVSLYSVGPGDKDTTFYSNYIYGSRAGGARLLQPGETTTLTRDKVSGDLNGTEPAKVLIQRVMWNNDDSRMWSGGKLLRKNPTTKQYEKEGEAVAH